MTSLGKYELHEQLGRGGFGIVYRATDTSLGRRVALKVLHPQLMVDETFIERFKREAQTLASLDHPNIVTIYEMGEIDARLFIAMRYLPGGNLQHMVKNQGALGYIKAVSIIKQVCEGLQVTHDLGLVHRDIKPANILFDARGNAVISDFGLARVVQLSESTSSGTPAGTPAYRAPELWRGKPPATPATDVYSLGCIFTEMLTGKVLFNGETPDEILTQHLIDGPDLPEHWPEGVPGGLSAVLTRSLSKVQTQRQKDAKAFFIEIAANSRRKRGLTKENEIDSKNVVPPNLQTIVGEEGYKSIPIMSKSVDEINRVNFNEFGSKKVELVPEIDMEFLLVPAGIFLMGSDAKFDPSALRSETPQHQVYLDEYWIGKYPVTVAQYQVFLKASRHKEPSDWNEQLNRDHLNYPVVKVKWIDAVEFCHWLSNECGQKISLPTEAQWEKAARGIDGRIYPWGNEAPDCTRANFYGCNGSINKVGSAQAGASPYGVLDMAGNVWEWVADWYCDYSSMSATNPRGPKSGMYRVLRGGSWNSNGDLIRTAIRNRSNHIDSSSYIGFRCSLCSSETP